MTTLTIAEAKAKLSEVLRRANSGEQFTITRNGSPLAQIGPIRAREGGFFDGEVIIHDEAWWEPDEELADEFGIA